MPVHVADFYSGWDKHNRLLVAALTPLQEEHLRWAPAADMWNVRRLANHIVAARAWWFAGWMGEESVTLDPLIAFDDAPGADERAAGSICEALNASWAAVAKCLSKWTESDLDQKFQRPRPNQEGERPVRDRRYIIWHVAEHDMHHGGEISLILGMHGGKGLDL